ncbi:MAG: cyclic nucleotide-binding domain-containing protein, partial [Rhodobacteraceae bacterium]|nr:cyclic nucleotide-binding domain-containing protein [Paracoccaceae bacterium]
MDFSSRVSFWRRCDPFGKLSEDALAAIARHAQSRNWQAGSMIFQRGDTGDFLIAIGSGSVRLSLLTPQGQSLILRQAGPNEIIGELAVIDDKPRSA